MVFKKGNKEFLGRKHTPEARAKISDARRRAHADPNSGYHNPELRRAAGERFSKLMKGRPKSEEHKRKMRLYRLSVRAQRSEMFRGSKNPMWRGGRTSLRRSLINSLRYKEWRKAVYVRDNYTCVLCGDHNHPGRGSSLRIEADHFVEPFSIVVGRIVDEVGMDRAFDEIIARDSVWDISLGRTLCKKCHSETPTYMGRMKNYNKCA